MKKIIKFGEDVSGYSIPVLNEREVRASAGIYFVLMLIALFLILFKGNFVMIKYMITAFLADFITRVFISPRFSPSLILSRWIVRNQVPEYVGAPQKKFAWIIGVALAATMFVLMVLVNSYSPITGIICLICLVFLFFESAFGICLGCKFYSMVYREKVQYCPGEVCEAGARHDIQKISGAQLLVIVGFVAFIAATAYLFNETFSVQPFDLFGISEPVVPK